MDDLLIVRLSDHSKERYRNRSQRAPVGANLGVVAGAALSFALGLGLFPENLDATFFAALIGAACGVALGGLFGRFVTIRRRQPRPKLYDGLPFSAPDGEDRNGDSSRF